MQQAQESWGEADLIICEQIEKDRDIESRFRDTKKKVNKKKRKAKRKNQRSARRAA